MRALTTVLAICGIYFALLSLAGLSITVVALFIPPETGTNILTHTGMCLGMVALYTSGYFVWWGWVFHSFKERFPFVTQQTFWGINLAHHIVWVVVLIPADVWGGSDDPWPFPFWIIANILIATIVLMLRPWNRVQTEPSVAAI